MNTDFGKLMSGKSDAALQAYLDKRTKFVPGAVEAAIAELQTRGRTFTPEELEGIRSDLTKRKEIADKLEKDSWVWKKGWRRNIVDDEDAPEYYSELAIYLFSMFFGLIFGAVLLALNLYAAGKKKGFWAVLTFGIVFSALSISVLSQAGLDTGLSFVINCLGAAILNYFFWPKYIGASVKYRVKPVWTPLVTSVIIKIPFMIIAFQEMYK